jgi:hypothetical protein
MLIKCSYTKLLNTILSPILKSPRSYNQIVRFYKKIKKRMLANVLILDYQILPYTPLKSPKSRSQIVRFYKKE